MRAQSKDAPFKEIGAMKFAIWDNTNPRDGVSAHALYRQHLDDVVLAEELGFDHFWFYEHHVTPRIPMPSPNLMIAAAARATSTIRLGNMVNVLPYRHPLLVAEEVAMLDAMTDGRLDVGLGRGGIKPEEWQAFGVEQGRSRDIFDEAYRLLLRIWADENFTHAGEFFRVEKRTPLSPPLVQRPHPPLYVGAQSPESLRWAAENDIPFGQIDALIESCKRDQDFYREIQVASGHKPTPRLFLTLPVYVAESDERARRESYPYIVQYAQKWARYIEVTDVSPYRDDDIVRQRTPILHAMSFDELVDRGPALVGSAETVRAKIETYRAALDIAVLVCVFSLVSMPHAMVQRSMRNFAARVMPALAAPLPPARVGWPSRRFAP
jgi:alkanesulfonate monooxygenase SsuD/methylene tetrahydromethanopterin reductase-like flavin-dependent oxidoreductase (luciferase family)